ncbi:Golgi-specific brefeldin A-resistance guanine nucleotide exchange factor 1 isoform X5 [Cryptotermes secundus]|uniref:Golgi-specific brefeldin A-resistance guanine nucleotide exchange factor 1 isoform X5 n=1 Tax=Cryptotermes secundus TaxID=105785 RepID=UPI000CD7BD17|nr:Golgi-specific brefeldin A-resistance guanine nucleotide exchange factor 1 isoform X5 [Cryptotermes secundus]
MSNDEEQNTLIRNFTDVKDVLNQIGDLHDMDPNHFLGPFLEVIRSGETTGPVTSLALSAVHKFLSYGLINPTRKSVPATVENIADAVTHVKFVGTDQASDGVVLMKILQVLRVLMLSPEGAMLTNESVCEIMLSFFRICFESRLSELLCWSAEHCLKDVVQLLFSRLPHFCEDLRIQVNIKKLKMRTGGMDSSRGKRKSKTSQRGRSTRPVQKPDNSSLQAAKEMESPKSQESKAIVTNEDLTSPVDDLSISSTLCAPRLSTTPLTPAGNIVDMQGAIHQGTLPPIDDAGQMRQNDVSPETAADESEASRKAENEEMSLESTGAEQHSSVNGNEDTQSSSCVVINVDLGENSAYEYGDGDTSSILSSKTCSVEDVSLTGVQEELKSVTLQEGCEEKVTNEVRPDTVLVEVKEEPENVGTEENVAAVSVPKLSNQSSSVSIEEEEGTAGVKQAESQDYINPRGVRFMSQEIGQDGSQPLVPYGVACVRELFRFLISLCNPLDKQNTETMIHTGLSLLTVALEIGADSIGKYNSLLGLVKDELCRNLFSLLNTERLSIFAAALQVSFLLFEALRTHLKFQLEFYLTRVIDIIISDSPKITYEQKEIALDSVVQLWRIPGFVTELYLNYDCDLYCPNLFEDLTKLLSKNVFPVSGLYNTHLLSLDALLTIIDSIEGHCHSRILNEHQEDRQVTDGTSVKASSSEAVSDAGVAMVLPVSGHISHSRRQRISENIPTHEQLMAIKHKKKLLATGTEHFNLKAKKGVAFLQEHHLLSSPLDPQEVVHFLRENPRLDKKMIGEYISNRSNLQVLDSFVKSFDFTDTRIDEALRLYLETFRLPGESPLISLIMEHFAEHWHKQNGEPFADADAAFTLAYAVIMLNVDQHNYNVKRQNNPMTVDEFKRNLKKVNGGQDFDEELLDEIYNGIKTDEIVMPAEQTGLVKENYLWKVLLRRGASKDGVFIHAPNGLFDHDLFSLIWGPTVAALSFVFDKSNDATIYQKAISGFRKCAMISAHYGMSSDFDNLVISLCKFTMLLNTAETPDNLTISFGSNPKAQLAAKTVFNLAHRHGDILREGWKNVLDCMLQLYHCKLLPKVMVEAEDFIDPSGKISLMREETPSQKTEPGLLSSIYSYIALSSEPAAQKMPSPEDQEHIQRAHACVKECHIEHLINESKFLRLDSLQELVKALIFASQGPESHISSGMSYDEDATVFFLELLLKVVIQNRDRVTSIWRSVRDHVYCLVMSAAACDYHFLMERSVVGLLRLAIRLMRREDMSPVVMQSLRMLLLLKPAALFRVSRQIAYGLYELLKTSAANIHSDTDWSIIFTLLECVGAGAHPPRVVGDNSRGRSDQVAAKSDGDVPNEEDSGLGNERGYTSDSELSRVPTRQHSSLASRSTSPELSPNSTGGWILVGREGEIQPLAIRPLPVNQFSIVHERELLPHDPYGLVKCCESLAFLIRDVAHITPYNFENCVQCIRTFVEASLNGNDRRGVKKSPGSHKETKTRKKLAGRRKDENTRARSPQNVSNPYDADESDSEELPGGYHQVTIQLLDLMHTLHTRTAHIFRWWAEENGETDFTSLWAQGWCPLLQGIARLCCDSRRQVRMSAITYLQRALLVHDLQTLTASEWESCFSKVLFPLLSKLLEPLSPQDPTGVEETRMRAATVLSKVFLHHLTPLLTLPTFTALWLTILDFMDRYMHVDKSDLLYEAIPESLKNMLLVMDSAGVFSTPAGYSQLWTITWDRINTFLPTLKEELFRSHPAVETQARFATKPEDTSVASPDLQVPTVTSPVLNESTTVGDPAVSRVTSIILQPPAVAATRNVSTPIFMHLGQQMLSTSIGPPIQHAPSSHHTDITSPQPPTHPPSVEPVPNPLLYSQSQNVVPPVSLYSQPISLYSQPQNTLGSVTLYSQSKSSIPIYSQSQTTATSLHLSFSASSTSSAANLTDQPTVSNAGVMIPSHYFHHDVGQQQQLFPVSVPAPLSSSGMSSAGSSGGIVCSPNAILVNPSLMEGTSIPTRHILSSPKGLNNQ